MYAGIITAVTDDVKHYETLKTENILCMKLRENTE